MPAGAARPAAASWRAPSTPAAPPTPERSARGRGPRRLHTVRPAPRDMLGQRLVTKQTGPEGLPIETVYVESGSDIEREIYLSLTLNRERGRIAVIASAAGGMDIEEVAAHEPEKILRADIS